MKIGLLFKYLAIIVLICTYRVSLVEASEATMFVYKSKGAIQCQSKGLSSKKSEAILVEANVKVIASHCGILKNRLYPAVCGGGNAEIIIHEIKVGHLSMAESRGYMSIKELVDTKLKTQYEFVDC